MVPISEMTDDAVDAELHALTEEAGKVERRVLLFQARRLVAIGQRQYGELDAKGDRRCFRSERAEELGDAIVYTAFDAIAEEVSP